MKLDEVLQQAGKSKQRKRLGRGNGSGQGGTAGRGHKGYHARAGSGRLFGYEGGQSTQISRAPKRGFSNAGFKKEYQIVNLAGLNERFEDGARVDAAALAQARLIDDAACPVKVLAQGELTRKLTVVANKFSAAASEKISKAGGTTEQV